METLRFGTKGVRTERGAAERRQRLSSPGLLRRSSHRQAADAASSG
jgi:hypothetical protein